MFKKSILENFEKIREERLTELNNLTIDETCGVSFKEARKLLEEFFFHIELVKFEAESNKLLEKALKEIDWEKNNAEKIENIIKTSKKDFYDEEFRLEKADIRFHNFLRDNPSKIPPILRLLIEIEYLDDHILSLKKELGIENDQSHTPIKKFD